MRKLTQGSKIAVYADAEGYFKPISLHQELKKSGRLTQTARSTTLAMPELNTEIPLDFPTWLPFSAPHYHISSRIEDYLIVPVIIMPSDLPNRNSVGFPLRELVKFIPEYGMQAYKTWKGQPTHLEHANSDITKAYGVIADSFLRPMKTHGQNKIWKLMHLLTFDRSKHPELTTRIDNGEINSYSMGAYVDSYTCSYCGSDLGKCYHLNPKAQGEFYELENKLVHKNVRGVKGFETSAVGDPAYVSAISDEIKVLS